MIETSDQAFTTMTESHDTNLTATYVRVVLLEAVIIVALWVLGKLFS